MKLRVSIVVILFVLVGSLTASLVWHNWHKKWTTTEITQTADLGKTDKALEFDLELKNRVNILLIGADQRPQEGEKYNTDTLILASVDPHKKQISLLSIPRDTKVSIPGNPNVKINSVAALSDLEDLQSLVADLTGVPLSGYLLTNFNGFKNIVDTLGGITVNVEKDMYYETGDTQDGYINLHKGMQQLDGEKALQYVRFRHDALADISRTARQQVILKAIAKKMFSFSTLPKLPRLIPDLMRSMETNIGLKDIFKISKAAIGFDSSNVISQTLPGRFIDIDGISYWEVNPKEVKIVINNLFQGITTEKIIDDQEIDLLKPIVIPNKQLPKTPGNPVDPNGRKSSGYKDFDVELKPPKIIVIQ